MAGLSRSRLSRAGAQSPASMSLLRQCRSRLSSIYSNQRPLPLYIKFSHFSWHLGHPSFNTVSIRYMVNGLDHQKLTIIAIDHIADLTIYTINIYPVTSVVQDDTSGWAKPPIDIKTKVPFWPVHVRPKWNLCFDVWLNLMCHPVPTFWIRLLQ